MKALLLVILLSLNAHAAFDVCQFEDTTEFDEAVEAKKITLIKEVGDHNNWTTLEKKIIHTTITSDNYYARLNQAESLRVFGDYYDDSIKTGSNAGTIQYFAVGSYKFVLVHFWPGDNEVGAFVEVSPQGKIKILATISDQWMECKR